MGGEISLTSRLHQGSTFWFTLRLATTDLPQLHAIEGQYLQHKKVLLIEPNMQAASIVQQQLGQEGLLVTYQTSVPNEFDHQDSVLLCLSPKKSNSFSKVSEWVEKVQTYADHVIVAIPSTELALAEKISAKYRVQCMTKPLSRRKLLNSLAKHQQLKQSDIEVIEPEVLPQTESKKLPLTVMAVDDNPANLKLITALLKERVEKVVSCSSGQKAVDEAQQQSFDIVLMDIQMPHMDGVTACKKIKETDLNRQTPVIAVTAHAMSGERARLLKAGMDDYLTKPIEEHILQQVLVHWDPNASEAVDKLDIEQIVHVIEESTKPQADVIVDWQAALKQAANKEDLAKEMLQMLIDYIAEVSIIADQALENEAFPVDELLHHIHKLHGSCSYSGVPKLKAVCAQIEKLLRSGKGITEIEPELFELQDEMDKVLATAVLYLNHKK